MRKKGMLLLCILMIGIFFTGCEEESAPPEYTHLNKHENQLMEYTGARGTYVMGAIKPNGELREYGVFKKLANGGYSLLIKIGKNMSLPSFFDGECFYIVKNKLTQYDLTKESPTLDATYVDILPENIIVLDIEKWDSHWVYVYVVVMGDDGYEMKRTYYAARRDGSEYKEISFEDIPY